MTTIDAIDEAILVHLREHPRAYPQSCPDIRRLARGLLDSQPQRIDVKLIEARMKALRDTGRIRWQRAEKRYLIL